jgi:hypothetical protein
MGCRWLLSMTGGMGTLRYKCVPFNTLPYKEIRLVQLDASRVSLSQRADPVAERDLAEVGTGCD